MALNIVWPTRPLGLEHTPAPAATPSRSGRSARPLDRGRLVVQSPSARRDWLLQTSLSLRGGGMGGSVSGRAATCLMVFVATVARAQAWLPDAGTLSLSVVHSDIENNKHYLPNGDEIDVGHTRVFTEV